MRKYYDKLVRDNVINHIEANGEIPSWHILSKKTYRDKLDLKLSEEVDEFLASHDIEELADILEVVDALAKEHGSSFDELLNLKVKKQCINGGFTLQLNLDYVEEKGDNSDAETI